MHVELYEITQRYKDILNLIDGDLIKEEDVKAALDELRDEVEEKADSLACIVKSLLADIEAFKTEKARLNERQKKAVKAALDELRDEVEEKADSLACIVKSLLADIEAFKTEKARLNERQKKAEQYVDLLKMYLHDSMLDAGLKKIETSRNRIAFTSSKRVIVSDEESFKERYPDLLKMYLHDSMLDAGLKKIETSRNRIAFTSSKRVIVSDEESFKERYPDLCRQTVKIDLDKKAIKEAIESGENVVGAEIVGFKNINIK